jgi:pseudouridine-5'-phosphate glycosidase
VIRVADEVRDASAVVALETTIVAHGFPEGEGIRVGLESERRVREAGAVPATIGVLDGEIRVGLTPEELERFTAEARKLGPRDLAACIASGETGATTVGGTLAVCRQVGIRCLGTGGIGGVHRGDRFDVSADLLQLAWTPVVVTSSGVKSLLDVDATSELLESLGVPVLGYRTGTFPRFYDAEGGPPVSQRIESPAEAAAIANAHWELGGAGILLANPPPRSIDVEALIESALDEAVSLGTTGQPLTPFVLGRLHDESGGETLELNRQLAAANAGLAAAVAVGVASA